MIMNKNNLTIIVVLLVIIGGFWFWQSQPAGVVAPSGVVSSSTPFTATTSASDPKIELGTSSAPRVTKGVVPNLGHQVVYKTGLTVEQKKAIVSSIEQARGVLASDKFNFDAWIDLANVTSGAGDDNYAIEILKFVSLNTPKWALPESNLGMIYGYHIHDNTTAESHFRIALEREPNVAYYWIQTAQFFIDIDNEAEARRVLQTGKNKKVTDYQRLEQMLKSL
ncbi:MAG: hypothetical protein A2672_00880 [Candidatus Wildermuthbacteria bacterium RIFCSPHIGHO2_01_FULL_49_22b]|uniref:Tetratricopeptide repeat protein n=1 Tax=Candidatus Wildermuthbacteria bacterium RIFCSPHIGHO2_01_FULL_49_22b TaxID=1802448 RepID=A0A1G2QXE9_9BACT|nr:MAG: hypothetical protein A2672_00880 [Candidatus Wildermuthbacteria bacterium RIFCSPHIGHO2_01_FULL_49_22b]